MSPLPRSSRSRPSTRLTPGVPLLLGLAACSGSEGGSSPPLDAGGSSDGGGAVMLDERCVPDFGSAESCPSDLTGEWTYQTICSAEDPFAGFRGACAAATVSGVAYVTGGTLSLRADGTFSRTAQDRASATIAVPASCAALVQGCAGVPGAIELSVPDSTATCAEVGGGDCSCDVTRTVVTDDDGTYTAAAGAVTVNNGDRQLLYYYCTDGRVLKYRGVEDNPDRVSYVLTR